MLALLQSAQEDGLTLAELLADLPHDPASMVGYAFVAAFVGFVWWGNRKPRKAGSTSEPEAHPADGSGTVTPQARNG